MKKILPVSFLLFLYSFFACCQNSKRISYGIKAGYITAHRLYGNANVNGTQIIGSKKNFLDGFRFAGLARYEYKRWFAATELAYAYNLGGDNAYLVDNRGNPNNTSLSDEWAVGAGNLYQNAELTLSLGYKPLKWLRIYGGLTGAFVQIKDPYPLKLFPETRPFDKAVNEMARFQYALQESYNKWLAYKQIGIGVDIRRNFSVDVTYEKSLTPAGKTLSYKDNHYYFLQRASRVVVSLSYRIYKLKIQKTDNYLKIR